MGALADQVFERNSLGQRFLKGCVSLSFVKCRNSHDHVKLPEQYYWGCFVNGQYQKKRNHTDYMNGTVHISMGVAYTGHVIETSGIGLEDQEAENHKRCEWLGSSGRRPIPGRSGQ